MPRKIRVSVTLIWSALSGIYYTNGRKKASSFEGYLLNLAPEMQTRPTYNLLHRAAAIVMIGALSWLTVCLPYIYSFQKELAKQESRSVPFGCPLDNEESNPLGNSTEEKAPTTASEEYLHHTNDHNYLFSNRSGHDNRHAYDIYVAYHGEVQSPPPNFIS